MVGKNTAGINSADDQCLRALDARLGNREVSNPAIGVAAGKAQLSDAPFRPPVDDALRRLGSQLILHIPQKQEIWLGDVHEGKDLFGADAPRRTGEHYVELSRFRSKAGIGKLRPLLGLRYRIEQALEKVHIAVDSPTQHLLLLITLAD